LQKLQLPITGREHVTKTAPARRRQAVGGGGVAAAAAHNSKPESLSDSLLPLSTTHHK